MTFKLNEAPNRALSKISSEKASRGCGLLWSIVCCLPTLGLSACRDPEDWSANGKDYSQCCYPTPVSLESNAGVQSLIKTLNSLKEEAEEQKNEPDYIRWQVEQTINVLKDALDANVIQKSYRTAIQETHQELITRWKPEGLEATESTPLKLAVPSTSYA